MSYIGGSYFAEEGAARVWLPAANTVPKGSWQDNYKYI